HHDLNCARCYKLKKKCLRTYPACDYCQRLNTECEYIDRRKRRLRFEEVPASPGDTPPGPGQSRAPILVASLMNHDDDAEQPFRNIDPLAPPAGRAAPPADPGVSRTSSRMAPAALLRLKPLVSVNRNVISSCVVDRGAPSLQGELLAVRPVADAGLPSAFVHTFFANYEWKYPFLSRHDFCRKIENLSFQTETLVGLDVYLVMAIGCIIYDASFKTLHYAAVFSESFVESVVDVISYDIKSEDDLHKAHLLILLSIHAINVGNTNLIWNIVGFLDRLIVFLSDFTGLSNACMRKRCFWTIFNLDKELSLLLDKPSQFVPTPIIRLSADFSDSLHPGELDRSAAFMAHLVMLHSLQDRMLSHRLGLVPAEQELLTQLLAEIEAWRVGVLLLIHSEYAELSLLQNFIGLVNLDYYYLLIELDQLSETESFQFTLQFLLNSFSLLLSEVLDKKEVGGTSIYSLFWFLKFFKVVDYSVASLLRMLDANKNKSDLMIRLNEFNGNVQLEINLLKFLLESNSRPAPFVEKLKLYHQRLKTLNQKLV
ncbi:hypothetical protein METBIDRAFT_16178, partial [Metschnikowia bicuspidata var. bicuspidata NRRL YB-4993]